MINSYTCWLTDSHKGGNNRFPPLSVTWTNAHKADVFNKTSLAYPINGLHSFRLGCITVVLVFLFSDSEVSLIASKRIPSKIRPQPTILAQPIFSLNRREESTNTEMISKCEAAKAGPIGARLSNVIQVKKAPIYPTTAP